MSKWCRQAPKQLQKANCRPELKVYVAMGGRRLLAWQSLLGAASVAESLLYHVQKFLYQSERAQALRRSGLLETRRIVVYGAQQQVNGAPLNHVSDTRP